MTAVHAIEEVSESARGSTPLLGAIGAGLYMVVSIAQLIVMALDPIARIYVAPMLLALVVGAVLMIAATVSSLGELRAVVADRATRVVHGLEHACLAVLEQRGHTIHGGRTEPGRFAIEISNDGRVSALEVRRATREAVIRIAGGEEALAYSPRCGTSLFVALLLLSLVAVGGATCALLLGASAPHVILGCSVLGILARAAARPLGLLAQRTLTVSTQFVSAFVGEVTIEVSADGQRTRFVVPIEAQL